MIAMSVSIIGKKSRFNIFMAKKRDSWTILKIYFTQKDWWFVKNALVNLN